MLSLISLKGCWSVLWVKTASSIPLAFRLPSVAAADEVPYGYCTEIMIRGEDLDPDKIKTRLIKKGESLIVVGDDNTVKIHIHTLDPGNIVHFATGLGTIHQVSIRNMDEQHRDFVSAQKARAVATDVAVIAIVAGDGLEEVFTSLGVTAIIQGGQTMNPSAKDILQKVEQSSMDKVIVLPNNKNIVLTANQIKPLTQKTVEIIPTKTIPQGVAALLAFDYDADLETNINLMKQSIENIKTIEVTRAVRSTQIGGLKIKKKQIISLLDNELTAVGDDTAEVIMDTLDKIDLEKNEIVTLYYGMDITRAEGEKVAAAIRDKYPKLQVEIVRGDQPNYHYIISVE